MVIRVARKVIDEVFPQRGYQIVSVSPIRIDNLITMNLVNLRPEGWILTSADIRVKPVLGFSFRGSYSASINDVENPQNIWLNNYNEEIKNIISEKQEYINPGWDSSKNALISETGLMINLFIDNLIPVDWGQEDSWNQFCPEDPNGPGGHVYLGCVAVSMGQAMSVFSLPSYGIGTNSYLADGYGIQLADFGATEYKWDSMNYKSPDRYNSLLLYHCAVSVNMQFGADGSSALLTDATMALRGNFVYSRHIRLRERLTDDLAWMALLNQQLINGRPIIYSGDADDGLPGHAFNIDGVINSYYHINWGWSGANNGYFTINSLKPGNNDFTKNHSAILGIQPYYYPTGILLSDTIVPLNALSGSVVGIVSIVDEATDNSYTVKMISDSTWDGVSWIKDYFLDGYTLRTGRVFTEEDVPRDTIILTVTDRYKTTVSKNVILKIGANPSNIRNPDAINMSDLKIFPNPSEDLIFFETVDHNIIEEVMVYSPEGRLIMSEMIGSSKGLISVSSMNRGIYIFGARLRNNEVKWKKFIKK